MVVVHNIPEDPVESSTWRQSFELHASHCYRWKDIVNAAALGDGDRQPRKETDESQRVLKIDGHKANSTNQSTHTDVFIEEDGEVAEESKENMSGSLSMQVSVDGGQGGTLFFCPVCQKSCNSRIQLNSHNSSAKHLAKCAIEGVSPNKNNPRRKRTRKPKDASRLDSGGGGGGGSTTESRISRSKKVNGSSNNNNSNNNNNNNNNNNDNNNDNNNSNSSCNNNNNNSNNNNNNSNNSSSSITQIAVNDTVLTSSPTLLSGSEYSDSLLSPDTSPAPLEVVSAASNEIRPPNFHNISQDNTNSLSNGTAISFQYSSYDNNSPLLKRAAAFYTHVRTAFALFALLKYTMLSRIHKDRYAFSS